MPTVTLQGVPAASAAVPAVSVSVAVAVPELLPAAVNVVVPQPLIVMACGTAAMVKWGSTRAIELDGYNAVFIVKR